MDLIQALKKELMSEAETTRKFLTLVPEAKYNWAPHEKSMKMKDLAVHIAELPSWIAMAVDMGELDFAANEYTPTLFSNNIELRVIFEKSLEQGDEALTRVHPDDLEKRWVLRNGEAILWEGTKYGMIRQAFSQTAHHRAQLGVYLRLLNIPIPGSYGPSADDQKF
ncbi:DinB family protein [Olivibacter sp. XZL3]|uniref:DinB family protein n=1 Tax=Olivibacter sp. XZL3 TaxID=1735116 RepID=UPI001065BF77|nr:DinB family protein [Olivibacter sp. XZL3]